ncbi:MAG: zinc ribbon domain-containing protein [Betaproteobacteria bacterium]|nr:zinc ribbon domain-containing protein [Betaproteobacteria bacterium]
MPIYEYKCTSCGHKKELLQKLSDAPLRECPACGKSTLSKLISAAGFQLKGSGWYATDFKGGSKSAKPDKEKEDGQAKGESKSESKASDDNKAKGDNKPKEEVKSDVPASSAGASPAGQ